VLITDIAAERENRMNRISGNPGGALLWFESSDIELRPSPEAFGSALLLPSLHNGSTLTIDSSVNGTWLSNLEHLVDIYHDWWGYPKLVPNAFGSHNDRRSETGKTALFFSGGVDSFFSLLRHDQEIDALITVYGFDITLQDGPRIAALQASLSSIAAATRKESIIIRTNVREHPEFGKVFWERAHGGALAAVGHLLSNSFSRILISSSYPYAIDRPWGSHPKTDHLWSSDELKLVHFGAGVGRIEKLYSIVHEPLVRNHLRVCWENLTETGNCSRCEKCLRVRLVLAECDELDNFPVFEGPESLAQQVDALPQTTAYEPLYEQLVERGRLRADLDGAVRRLLKRSQNTERLPRRLAKGTVRRVLSMSGLAKR
jgi:hypothetical protein